MTASYQLAVIGSGTAGREAAILAARNGLRVVLIEQNGLGGTSFHRGYYVVRAFRACAEMSRASFGGNGAQSAFGTRIGRVVKHAGESDCKISSRIPDNT